MQATNIDDVISLLDQIIDTAKQQHSRIGYFASLYRRMTMTIRQGIANNAFDDGPRMERLDTVFANRYFAAFDAHHQNKSSIVSWEIAFRAAESWEPVLAQHLLLGINAHINLDLGLAAAIICPGDQINGLKTDFYKINDVIASIVEEVKREFDEVWPVLTVFDRMLRRQSDALIDNNIDQWRDRAWRVAKHFAYLDTAHYDAEIAALDKRVATWAWQLRNPMLPVRLFFYPFRLTMRQPIPSVIDILCEPALSPARRNKQPQKN